MKVAEVFYAVNTPIAVDGEAKLGKIKIRYSSASHVIASGGRFVGYTALKKTNDLAADRVVIGDSEYLVTLGWSMVSADEVSYCLCIDDTENKWVAVMPRYWKLPTIKSSNNRRGENNSREIITIGICIVIIIIICIVLLVIKMAHGGIRNTLVNTEVTTQIVHGGESVTYEYGASVSTEATIEAEYEELIEECKDVAEQELANTPTSNNAVANDTEQTDEDPEVTYESSSSSSSSAVQKPESTEDKTVNPVVSSIEETVIVPKYESSASDLEETISVSGVNEIGDITLASGVGSFTLNNNTDFTLSFQLKNGSDVLVDVTILPGASQEIQLRDKLKESTKLKANLKYLTSEGALYSQFNTDIWVNIV